MLCDGTHPVYGLSPTGELADRGDLTLPNTSLEGMRAALTNNVPHMSLVAIYLTLIGFTTFFLKLGIDGFKKRVLS